jgi:hypothetical protein
MSRDPTSIAHREPLYLGIRDLAQPCKDPRYFSQEIQRGHHNWKASNQCDQQTLLQDLESPWECGTVTITYQRPLSTECALL